MTPNMKRSLLINSFLHFVPIIILNWRRERIAKISDTKLPCAATMLKAFLSIIKLDKKYDLLWRFLWTFGFTFTDTLSLIKCLLVSHQFKIRKDDKSSFLIALNIIIFPRRKLRARPRKGNSEKTFTHSRNSIPIYIKKYLNIHKKVTHFAMKLFFFPFAKCN